MMMRLSVSATLLAWTAAIAAIDSTLAHSDNQGLQLRSVPVPVASSHHGLEEEERDLEEEEEANDIRGQTEIDNVAIFGAPYYHHIPWKTFPDPNALTADSFTGPISLTPGFSLGGQSAKVGVTLVYQVSAGTNKDVLCQMMDANGVVLCACTVQTDSVLGTVTMCITPTSDFNDLTVLCTVTSNGVSGCFSQEMTVHVEDDDRGMVPMKDLARGDRVMVEPAKYGRPPVYQPVYGFGHYHPTLTMEYLQIYTYENPRQALELTGNHLIYVQGYREPVRADELSIGDSFLLSSLPASYHGTSYNNNTSIYSEIVKIDRVAKDGAYLPLTQAGTLVVNGIYTSAYVSISDVAPEIVERLPWFVSEQAFFHWWLAPYRIACTTISNDLCDRMTVYDDQGILQWLSWGQALAKFGNQQHPWIQSLGLQLVLACFSLCALVEQVLLHQLRLVVIFAWFCKWLVLDQVLFYQLRLVLILAWFVGWFVLVWQPFFRTFLLCVLVARCTLRPSCCGSCQGGSHVHYCSKTEKQGKTKSP